MDDNVRATLTRLVKLNLYVAHYLDCCWLYALPVGSGGCHGRMHCIEFESVREFLTPIDNPAGLSSIPRYVLADKLPEWIELIRVQAQLGEMGP